MENEEPRLLRASDIMNENTHKKTTFYRELDFLADNKFIVKARGGERVYYVLTPKGINLIHLEKEPGFVFDIFEGIDKLISEG